MSITQKLWGLTLRRIAVICVYLDSELLDYPEISFSETVVDLFSNIKHFL